MDGMHGACQVTPSLNPAIKEESITCQLLSKVNLKDTYHLRPEVSLEVALAEGGRARPADAGAGAAAAGTAKGRRLQPSSCASASLCASSALVSCGRGEGLCVGRRRDGSNGSTVPSPK